MLPVRTYFCVIWVKKEKYIIGLMRVYNWLDGRLNEGFSVPYFLIYFPWCNSCCAFLSNGLFILLPLVQQFSFLKCSML